MFVLLFYGLQVVLPIVFFVGMALALERVFPKIGYCLLFCALPLVFLIPFFIEHSVGLSRPGWLVAPLTLSSAFFIYRRGWSLLRESCLWFFLLGYVVVFFWRCQVPDIATEDKLANLQFVVDCCDGAPLPPEDHWLQGEHVDNCCYFQFYMWAWLSRVLSAPPGVSCNLGACLLVGFASAAIGSAILRLTNSVTAGVIATLQITCGAAGSVLLVPILFKNYDHWSPFQFVGGTFEPGNPDLNGLARSLVNSLGTASNRCPMEYYAHSIVQGDLNPLLGAQYLLSLLLLCICMAERETKSSLTDRACVGVATLIPAAAIVWDGWVVPLVGMVWIGWMLNRYFSSKNASWREIGAWAVVGAILAIPFLCSFLPGSRNYHVDFQVTEIPVPLTNWMLMMYPALIFLGLVIGSLYGWWVRGGIVALISLYSILRLSGAQTAGTMGFFLVDLLMLLAIGALGIRALWSEGLARFFIPMSIALLLFTYFVHLDDYWGPYVNTSMRWWPWAYAFVLILGFGMLWPMSRVVRFGSIGVMALTIVPYLYLCALQGFHGPLLSQLDGSLPLRIRVEQNAILNFLNNSPQGTILESGSEIGSDNYPRYAPFTDDYSLGGWLEREMVWRGNARPDLQRLRDDRNAFYKGELADPLGWLTSHRVTYAIWGSDDNERDDRKGFDRWQKINAAVSSTYEWRDFGRPDLPIGQVPLGIWVRRPAAAD